MFHRLLSRILDPFLRTHTVTTQRRRQFSVGPNGEKVADRIHAMAAQPSKQISAGPNGVKVADHIHTMAAQPGKQFSVGPSGEAVADPTYTMAAQPRRHFSVGPDGKPVADQPRNQHLSVGPDGETVVDFTFASEALGMPAEQGYGWTRWSFGEKVGPDARYTIVRKLGWGSHSSAWLARDAATSYVVIKALTGHITRLHQEGKTWEMRALTLVSSPRTSPHCLHSLADFTVAGTGSSGDHLCIVTPVYGGDVKALYHANDGIFPLPLAKRILLHLLRGLVFAHERNIVHTDLKMDNIFFTTPLSNNDIDQIVEKDPPRLHEPEMSHDGIVCAAVSQPLPMISIDEAMTSTFLLADFGSG
jgi:hypothetical protein